MTFRRIMALNLSLLTLFLFSFNISFSGVNLIIFCGEIFIFALILDYLIEVVTKHKKIQFNPASILLLAIVYFGFYSIINASDYGRYLLGWFNYVEVLLIFTVVLNQNFNETQIRKALLFFLASSVVLVFKIFFETYVVNGGNFILGKKIILDVGGSNYLASMLLLPFSIMFTILTRVKTFKLSISIFLTAMLVGIAIIFTGSRTAILIVAILIPLFLLSDIVNSNQKAFRKSLNIFITLAGVAVAYNFFERFISQMFQTGRFDDLFNQSNVIARYTIFSDYFDAFLKHPFVGNGFMNVHSQGEQILAHNSFFQIFADGGILTGISFVALMIFIFVRLGKIVAYKVQDLFYSSFIIGYRRGFLAIFLHGLFEPNFGTKIFMLYIFIGLALIFVLEREILKGRIIHQTLIKVPEGAE